MGILIRGDDPLIMTQVNSRTLQGPGVSTPGRYRRGQSPNHAVRCGKVLGLIFTNLLRDRPYSGGGQVVVIRSVSKIDLLQ